MDQGDYLLLREAYQVVWQQVSDVNQLLACDNEAWLQLGAALPPTLNLPVVEWATLDTEQQEEMNALLQALQEQIARFNVETTNWHLRRKHQLTSMQMQRKILHHYNK